jgi:hypothetical protein
MSSPWTSATTGADAWSTTHSLHSNNFAGASSTAAARAAGVSTNTSSDDIPRQSGRPGVAAPLRRGHPDLAGVGVRQSGPREALLSAVALSGI